MPADCIQHKHPLFDLLDPEIFLSKLCAKTFGEYAMGQIRKARGLNKKIVNPQPEKRLALLNFCHVPQGQGSVPVLDWLFDRKAEPAQCGLTAVQHATGIFAIYHDITINYRGLVSPKDPDTLIFSSVPKEAEPVGWMQFNHDAFRAHCKAHCEYWEWVGQHNEERYVTNTSMGVVMIQKIFFTRSAYSTWRARLHVMEFSTSAARILSIYCELGQVNLNMKIWLVMQKNNSQEWSQRSKYHIYKIDQIGSG